MMMLNVLRTLMSKPDAVEPMDATAEPVPPQPDQRLVSKRSRASFPKPMPASGTAHDHSLPPYISMN